jgi:adenosylhomocysteine nucleosidase
VPSIIVAAPQIEEADAILGALVRKGLPVDEVQIGRLQCASVPALDLILAVAGTGKAQFAVQAQHLIDHCPEATLLICAGAAGRLVDILDPGDVVVGTTTIEHDYKERFLPEPLPAYDADAGALLEIRHVAGQSPFPFRVTFGRIASGDEDVVQPRRAAQIRSATNAVCVAWEGSGAARAARFSGIGFLEIRAITDGADEHAAQAFRENVTTAMSHAAELLIAWQVQLRTAAANGVVVDPSGRVS